MKRIGILGAGTWGMALARMLTVSGNDVLVWSAIEKEIDSLSTTRKHPNLPQMKIPDELRFTKSIEEVCKDKDILLFAVPSVFVRSTAAKARPYVADGQIIVDVAKGIEPDTLYTMTEILADELGKELQVENMSFDYLLTSLAKGDFDIVMAAIEVTPERLQSADFSDPYYTDLPAMILVKADAADQYNTLADFAGKSVGAQTATTKEAIVTDQMEGANLVSLSLVTDLVNELVYGKVDAIVVDGAVAEQYAESNPDLVVAAASSELGEAQPYCIAVAKGDPKGLLPGINEAIAKMTSENKMEEFIAAADELSGKAVEVTADAPAA